MDLLHKFLNIVLLPITLTVLLLFMPPFLFLKFLWSLKRSIYRENVAAKVILITGASSGIGEYVAYEYAKRGARLALVARREDRLQAVADRARKLGSPEVVVVRADVSKVEECKQFVNEIVNYFGRLDHLVNNAGVSQICLFEVFTQFSDIASIMDINFWGSVYSTHYAIPHLRKSKGKIVVIASTAAWLGTPGLSFYNASKAALISFFETLRTEFGQDIGITIVTPGIIESEMIQRFSQQNKKEMTQGEFFSEVQANWIPTETTEGCAKAILDSTCNGDMYLTEPSWMKAGFWVKTLCPEVFEWCVHSLFVIWPWTSKKD
ncbi:11-beta-hydroxysteroid dehydrogenase-like 4A isoform X1 [Quercus lobata]|uniref:11-beta-hydroxysteroid dehydrogenase-like 4A isoform X1 n=1 Tax=Quercus lobata TaxID=97700 RepID=UPI001248FCCB|nr:11-beta-hydroxysteroid dehydrogenase-like 4A isoform X1 [Quercus lobata]